MANGDFGPWEYRGYTIERYLGESGPAEFIVTKDGGDDIAVGASQADAQNIIDELIADAAEFYASNVETISDRS